MPGRFPLFPDHEVLAEVGRGTLGTVYKVLSRRFRDVRALKRIVAPEPDLAHRIKREFRRLTAIQHPGLVRPTEMFAVSDSLCITSEFIEGRDLVGFLGPGTAGDPERVRQLIYLVGQALKALEHLHGLGVVHCGVKPTNLLVARDLRLRVTDAAMTREDNHTGDNVERLTELGSAWLAPEQLLGRPVDARSDLYSLGLVFFTALIGHRPQSGEGALAVELQARMRRDPDAIGLGSHPLDRALAPFLRRMLSRAPEGRFRSTAEARTELKRAWEQLSGSSAAAELSAPGETAARTAPMAVLADERKKTQPMPRTDAVREAVAAREQARRTGTTDPSSHTRPVPRPDLGSRRSGTSGPRVVDGTHTTAEMRVSDLHLAEVLAAGSEEALPRIGPALVGRDAELRQLAEALALAQTGDGRTVVVSGECGSGKSRLLAEFASMARADGVPIVAGRHEEGPGGPASAVVALLESLARRLLRLTPPERGRLMPAQAVLLGDLSPGFRELTGGGEALSSEMARDPRRAIELRAALAELVRNLAAGGPLVLLLEDLHQGDAAVAALIDHLARNLAATPRGSRPPVLLLLSYRSDEAGPRHPLTQTLRALETDVPLARIELARLSAADTARLAASMLGVVEIPADLARRLARDTGGNPLFVVETVHLLSEGGALRLVDGRVEADASAIARAKGPKGESVPARVRRVVEERLAGLEPALVELLHIAALSPGEIRFEVLREASGHAEDELHDLLHQALQSRLLAESPDAPGRYVFDRDEVRSVLIASLDSTRHAGLAGRLARALEHVLGARRTERAGDLAALWDRAGEPTRAIEHLLAAGDERARNADPAGAIERWTRLIELIGAEPATGRAKHLGLELEARKRLARTRLAGGELALARGEYEELVRRAQTTRRLPDEVDARNGLAEACWKAGDLVRAREAAGVALEKARALSYTAGEATALESLGVVARRVWELKEASQSFREALKLRRAMGDASGSARLLHNLGLVFRNQDQLDKARKHFEEARAAYTRAGDRFGIAVAATGLAGLHLREEHIEPALALYREARAIDLELGNRRGVALCDEGIGAAHLVAGGYREALQHFERALAAFRAIGDRPNEAQALISLGHTYHRTGNHREAAKRYREALALPGATANPISESEARSGLALALHALGERGPAAEAARAAVEAAHSRGSTEREAWARHTLAAVTGSIDDAERALTLAEATGNGNLLCQLHHQIANLAIERGERERAREHFHKAFTIVDSLAEKSGEARELFLNKPAIAAIFRDSQRL